MAQFAVMAAIVGAWVLPPAWPDVVQRPFRYAGIAPAVSGLALALWAHRSLGRSFTTFTSPPPSAERVEAGPYRLARHPMYGGGILLFGGLSLGFSVPALALTVGLAVLWRAKSAVEERVLALRFPDYDAYRRRTPRRFVPGIY